MNSAQRYGLWVLGIGFTVVALVMGFWVWAYHQILDYPRMTNSMKYEVTKNLPDDFPRAVIIGDSRGLDINPLVIEEVTGEKIYNLSADSGKLIYAYYTLKRLIEQDAIDKVYMQFPEFLVRGEALYTGSLGTIVSRYSFDRADVKDLDQHLPGIYDKWKNMQFLGPEYFRLDVWRTLRKQPYKIFEIPFDKEIYMNTVKHFRGFRMRHKDQNKGYSQIVNTENGLIYDWSEVDDKINYKHETNNNNVAYEEIWGTYTKKLIDLLESNDIEYTVFLAPYPKEKAGQAVNLGFKPDNQAALVGLFPKERVKTKALVMPNDRFRDFSHLNYRGSEKYSQYVAEYIVQGKEPNPKKYQTVELQVKWEGEADTPYFEAVRAAEEARTKEIQQLKGEARKIEKAAEKEVKELQKQWEKVKIEFTSPEVNEPQPVAPPKPVEPAGEAAPAAGEEA